MDSHPSEACSEPYGALFKVELHADHCSPLYYFRHAHGAKVAVAEQIANEFRWKTGSDRAEGSGEYSEEDCLELERDLDKGLQRIRHETPEKPVRLKVLQARFVLDPVLYELTIVAEGTYKNFVRKLVRTSSLGPEMTGRCL